MSASHPGPAPALGLRGVRIQTGQRVLLDRVDLDIGAGECWCVLGPNGAGKSSLLHTLAGLRAPQAGSALLLGKPWARWRLRAAARHRALLLQHQADAFSASVRETVLLGRHPHIGRFGWAGAEDRRCVTAALEHLDLSALAERDVLTLSGGERQRVALATMLAQDPAVFLLDEPSAHLDLAHQASLFAHLSALTREQGRTVVFATHDCNLAARFASHALLLSGAGVLAFGQAARVLEPEQLSRLFAFPLVRACAQEASGFVPRW